MATIFEDFLAAADAAVDLIGSDEAAKRWGERSALAGFTIGGLAAHLGSQVHSARWALTAPRPEPAAVVTPLLDHYAKSIWIGVGTDAPVHREIRALGEQRARVGAAEQARATRAARREAAAVLATEGFDAATVIAVPWAEKRAMTAGDLLTTRLMELLVHGDDLAASLEVATPAYPASAFETVIDLLVRLSASRNGALPVLRALARAERAPRSIAAL